MQTPFPDIPRDLPAVAALGGHGSHAYLVGKGPSLDDLDASDFPDAAAPVVCVNESIHAVEKLKLPNPLFAIQQDRALRDDCRPSSPDARWLVSAQAWPETSAETDPRAVRYAPADLGLKTSSWTAQCALRLLAAAGATAVDMLAFDAALTRDCSYADAIGHTSFPYPDQRRNTRFVKAAQEYLQEAKEAGLAIRFLPPRDFWHVVLVCSQGTRYGKPHVEAMRKAVGKWLRNRHDIHVVGQGDIPLTRPWAKGWWAKLEIFRPDFPLLGGILYLDLDVVPGRPLELPNWDILRKGCLYGWRDPKPERGVNSSVMAFRAGDVTEPFTAYDASPVTSESGNPIFGDQEVINRALGQERIHWLWDNWSIDIRSYKINRLPADQRKPKDAHLTVFHGRPKPWDPEVGWVTLPAAAATAAAQADARQDATKAADVKQAEATKPAEAKAADVKQAEARQADARSDEVRQDEVRRLAAARASALPPPNISAIVSHEQAVLALVRERLAAGDFSPLELHSPAPPATARGMALILCHHGQDEARLRAAREALAWTLRSNPRPQAVILVEAAAEGEPRHFASLPGITYVPRTVPEDGKGIWLKEALWNIGARQAIAIEGITQLVFLDLDAAFVWQGWATAVARELASHDVISPHSHMFYADQADGLATGLLEATGSRLPRDGAHGSPGMAIAMTADLYRRLPNPRGGIADIIVGNGDAFLWSQLAGVSWGNIAAWNLTEVELQGMRPSPRIGCAGQVICHHPHGPLAARCYIERQTLCRACSPAADSAVDLSRPDGMPRWRDTHGARILARAFPMLRELAAAGKAGGRAGARDLYDRIAIEEYGPIDADHPLVVACLLRSGGGYGPRHVRWLRDQFAARCRAPHRFVCLADTDIPGVETIPLENSAAMAPNAWGQVELYRDIWPRDATVVTCDLDTVVFRDFTPHRCPEGQLFMLRERGNWHRSAWAVWGAGLTVFRGDFSFIPRMFREDRLAGGERDPLYAHISSQEFITCALRAHGRLPMDIDPHLCARYYQGRPDSIVPDAHIAVFPAHPKPWEISPRPDWIPPLPED